MTLHVAVAQLNIRTFDDSLTVDTDKPIHEMREKYEQFFIIRIDDVGTARIEGLSKILSKDQIKQLKIVCANHGAKTFAYRHNGIEYKGDLIKYLQK